MPSRGASRTYGSGCAPPFRGGWSNHRETAERARWIRRTYVTSVLGALVIGRSLLGSGWRRGTTVALTSDPPTSLAPVPVPPVLEYEGLAPAAPSSRTHLGGVLLLSFITLLWGTTFALTRRLETDPASPLSPGMLITLRFLLAALVCSPGLLMGRADHSRWRLWRVGVELGFWLWCGYATQTIGLTTTTSGRSAFITSLNVVFVPAFVAPWGRRVGWRVWAAAAMALAGTALLCHDNGQPNGGDAWTLLCAAAWAVYILRLEKYAHQFPSVALSAVQLWTVAVLSGVWVGLGSGSVQAQVSHLTRISFSEIAYLGVVTTALTTWLQMIGQRTVPAPQASLLYTMEPVWASLFAWLIAGEAFGPVGWAGAALILGAAVGSQWPTGQPMAAGGAPWRPGEKP